LLTGIPLAASSVEAELTTPTGAAIVATLCGTFGPPPNFTIRKIGYGAGTRDLEEQPNILRILLGERDETAVAADSQLHAWPTLETIWTLETNLDDVSGEVLGHAQAQLLSAGALDVFVTPMQMKKGRPAVLFSVLCRAEQCEELERLIFIETGTLGVRRHATARRALPRIIRAVETPWGEVRGKVVQLPAQAEQFSPEYEDCRRIADKTLVPLRIVLETATRAYSAREGS
jgi:hypothetical protein